MIQSGASSDDTLATSYRYTSPPPVRSYPSSYATIQGWIDAGNTQLIRAHGWDIWASITSATPYGIPTWQTWYSGQEIFPPAAQQAAIGRPRDGIIRFRPMRQEADTSGAPAATDTIKENRAERVFAFNRFTKSTAEFIWRNRLNSGNRLRDTSVGFSKTGTPLALREVLVSTDSTDSASFVLKPVFQFISGTGVTAVPYWAGDSSAVTTDSANPVAITWKQAVAVSPDGQYKPGDSVKMSFNGQPARYITVVPLSAFYHVRITAQDSANFTNFGAINGDFIGVDNKTDSASVLAAVRPGNYGLLMAMHVTGKEIPNWTWQSFWWAYNPNDQDGADRPASIPAPWNHYDMTVAYSMLQPNGQQLIAYNPYLETSLGGKYPKALPPSRDSVSWTGVTSNCMSCHRRAAIGYSRGASVSPPYANDMQVNPGDSLVFSQPAALTLGGRAQTVKTDFLWSIVVRASTPTVAEMGKRKP